MLSKSTRQVLLLLLSFGIAMTTAGCSVLAPGPSAAEIEAKLRSEAEAIARSEALDQELEIQTRVDEVCVPIWAALKKEADQSMQDIDWETETQNMRNLAYTLGDIVARTKPIDGSNVLELVAEQAAATAALVDEREQTGAQSTQSWLAFRSTYVALASACGQTVIFGE